MRNQVDAFEEWAVDQEKEKPELYKLVSIGKDPSSTITDAKGTAEIKKGDEVINIPWSAKCLQGFWHATLDKQELLTDLSAISDIEGQINDNID